MLVEVRAFTLRRVHVMLHPTLLVAVLLATTTAHGVFELVRIEDGHFSSKRTRTGAVDDLSLERLTRSKGRAIITASGPAEVSMEGVLPLAKVRGR